MSFEKYRFYLFKNILWTAFATIGSECCALTSGFVIEIWNRADGITDFEIRILIYNRRGAGTESFGVHVDAKMLFKYSLKYGLCEG